MELFKEINNLVNIIIWPFTVILIVILLRKMIAGLFDRINSAKYKELQIEFKEIMAESEEIIIKTNKIDHEKPLKSYAMTTEFLNKLNEISNVSPRSLIIESWIQLETVLNEIGKNYVSGSIRQTLNVKDLVDNNVIDKSDMEIYNNVRKIRNNILHNSDYRVSKDESIEYALLIYKLMENINRKKNA